MKSKELFRFCAIKKNNNFRLIDTCNMTESQRVFLLTSLGDDKIEKHFFNFSAKICRCNRLQTDIDFLKTCLIFAKTTEEKQNYNYELEVLQTLLNLNILSLRK